jgi:prophage regulatory protein
MRNLITKRQTAKMLGFHPEHLMRLSRDGAFPRPIKLGHAPNSAVRFAEDEVEAWLAARIDARDQAAA